MKDADVWTKFTENSEPVLGVEQTAMILEQWWDVGRLTPAQLSGALNRLDRKT
jgi:hypothetical protein